MLRHPLALLLLVLLPLGLGGCLFDQPLTDPNSLTTPNIDSRLLGVFEFREGPQEKRKPAKPDPEASPTPSPTPDNVNVQRLAVMPLGPNKYIIYYRDFSKRPAKTYKFTGWLSRVDSTNYISFRDDTDGSESFGKYGFFKFEWEFPGNFLLYAPDMKESENAKSPFEMRKALRAKIKAGTAFPYTATYWSKIARIWWDPKAAEAGTNIPPEFENGTTRQDPGL
ncbi:MAG TPA: hypothetical protein VIM61_14825 [Chthoniobacterales bacterium]